MDFAGILIIPLGALITVGSMLGAALLSRSRPRLIYPFAVSVILGILLLGPWRWPERDPFVLFAAEFGLIALWASGGVVLGAIFSVGFLGLLRGLRKVMRPRA